MWVWRKIIFTIGRKKDKTSCHLLYLTQQPVTNWAIYTGLALGGQETCTISGVTAVSWVSIRALDLWRREELQAISLSGVVRCWGGEFTQTPIPLQFWRIQTLNLTIAFIVTPRTGLMVQLLGRWCEILQQASITSNARTLQFLPSSLVGVVACSSYTIACELQLKMVS